MSRKMPVLPAQILHPNKRLAIRYQDEHLEELVKQQIWKRNRKEKEAPCLQV